MNATTHPSPYTSVIPILNRLMQRTDLPGDVVATLQIAAEVAAFAEVQQFKNGCAEGDRASKERLAKIFFQPLQQALNKK